MDFSSCQELQVAPEPSNIKDGKAVATFPEGDDVGHLPIEFSKIAWHFIQRGGRISCIITGHRKYSEEPNKGLEVPCTYTFEGKAALIKRLVQLMADKKI